MTKPPRQFSLRDPHPQPLAQPGEQRREDVVEDEEHDAAREWLRHVEAGKFGTPVGFTTKAGAM